MSDSIIINNGNHNPRVIIGIAHYPHMNFYKNAIEILKKKNIGIELVIRPRGNLLSIVEKEYNHPSFCLISKHRRSTLGKMFSLIEGDVQTLRYLRKKDFDVVTACGGINLTHATYLLRKPSIMFDDDIEYKLGFYSYKPFANRVVIPGCIPIKGKNILKYNGFKELAHLHPNYFTPNRKILKQYDIKSNNNKYVLIREQSPVSLVYRHAYIGELLEIAKYLKDRGFKILLSLEDKSKADIYKDIGTVLKEPVEEFHSLLKFASLVITSGDTLARESCLVGTPAIYTGGRDMYVNKELIRRNCLFKVDERENIMDTVAKIIESDLKKETRKKIARAIMEEWDDTTEVIINNLLSVIYNDDSLIGKYREK